MRKGQDEIWHSAFNARSFVCIGKDWAMSTMEHELTRARKRLNSNGPLVCKGTAKVLRGLFFVGMEALRLFDNERFVTSDGLHQDGQMLGPYVFGSQDENRPSAFIC